MKFFLTIIILISLLSCSNNIYGVYNNKYSKDKSVFFQIMLNPDKTIEKKEIHTVSIFSKGKWKKENDKIVCYLDSTETGFPADTLTFKIKNKKLFPIRNGIVNKNFFLKKEQ
ncbi:hypothetical protein ABE425_06825 [Chryseobacterium cucumeris]|uniref:hypothetical protein n=1 Tax=Chryseobacterium cucumeris TaxID=1813611 RepID=UPI00320A6FEB